jgi:carbonic anhydrase/acetyltransferase-like protein (isoleucine patch superfamily)
MPESKLFGGSGPVKLTSGLDSERMKYTSPPDTQTGETKQITPIQSPPAPPERPIDKSERRDEGRITISGSDLERQQSTMVVEIHDEPSRTTSKPHIPSPMYSQGTSATQSYNAAHLEPNIITSWAPTQKSPKVSVDSFIHPRGLIIGNVIIEKGVFVAPFVAIRGDEQEPIYIGEESAILEGAIINALPTRRDGEKLTNRLLKVGADEYPVYIAQKVTVCQGVNIHGPAYIGKNTYVGMGSLIFWAEIGQNCVIEPGALVINVKIPPDRFIPAGFSVTSQKIVETLPVITAKYRFARINQEMLDENREILKGYLRH